MKPIIILLAYGEMAPSAYQALVKDFTVKVIITPPGNNSAKIPVEIVAAKHKSTIVRTNSNSEIKNIIKRHSPQALVICSYNKILSSEILNLTTCINVHHGNLPRWRGRANLNWAIITGRNSVGLTIHEAIPDLDAGHIYVQYMIPISTKETIKTLYDKVNSLLEKNLSYIVNQVIHGLKGKPQKGKTTYCCTRLPNDGLIDWNKNTVEIDRLVRALTKPFPGAFTYYNNQRLTIWSTEIPRTPRVYEGRIPGRIVMVHKNYGIEVLTGDSSLIVKDVTFAGKEQNSTQIIKTVKASLGIDFVELVENLTKKT